MHWLGRSIVAGMLLTAPTWSNSAIAQGTLRVAFGSSLNTLDPAKTKIGEEYIQNFLIYSGVTEIDRDGKLKPDLAESWTASDDVKTWTFKIRKGVKFHHGREADAEDVKATIERVIDKATGSVARVNFEIIDKMEVLDSHTIKFELKTPYAGFAEILSDRQARVVPRDKLETIGQEPIGTGPFKFKSYKPGDRVELVKNADYFVAGTPKLDAITFRIMPESAAQVTALETGEVDLVWNLPLESIERFQKNANVTVNSVATSTWDGVIMNGAHKPFDDVRVRRAVALALDKKALVEAALYGHGSVTHTMISPTHPYYNKDIAITGPDIAGAKKLLAEAGHPERVQDDDLRAERSASARARRHHRQGAAETGRHRRRCPARAVGQVRQGHRGQGGLLRRRLLQPADHRYLHLSLVSQQGIMEHGALELQERGHGQGSRCGARRQVGR